MTSATPTTFPRENLHAWPRRRALLWLNVVGGTAVLGSYYWGSLHPEAFRGLWGGVPESLRPLYTVNMFLAAGGYLMALWALLRMSPAFEAATFRALLIAYAVVLAGSALWLPLTFAWFAAPSDPLWWVIRLDLFAVGAGAIALAFPLARARGGETATLRRLGLLGLAPFVLQTAGLDALLWPAWFPH